ncbi:hypothetical protein AB0873_25345 [Micromonospora sp. NPDC047707]|uniref:hypothetical protein n=1 Tax=Micromonospora sp. NPDC047707 TaxID=3154498 RepID=UPI00345238FD
MIRRRLLRAVTALVVAVTGGALAVPSSAQAYGVRTLYPSTWAWTDSAQPHTSFVGHKTDAPVGRWVDDQEEAHISRFYVSYDLTPLRGRSIHDADLAVRERRVTDCSRTAPIELWRTGGIGPATSWKKAPTELERVAVLSRAEAQPCPNGYLVQDLTDALRAALARGDSTITFGLRIAAGAEKDKSLSRWVAYNVPLDVWQNTRPTVSDATQSLPTGTCGTAQSPVPVNGNGTSFQAKVSDPDPNDWPWAAFAAWPVDQPDQRREQRGVGYGGGVYRVDWNTSDYPHDTLVAWAARADDGYDRSDWSEPCHVRVDRVAPAQAPEVTSTDYPAGSWPGSGGVGVPGTFRFDPKGEADVTRYRVYDSSLGGNQIVNAPAPGEAATFTWTPRRSGPHRFEVVSIDAAGNVSPEREYEFVVRYTEPDVEVDVAGVGLPSRITMRSPIAEVTSFGYRLGDAPEVRVPATDAAATATVTFASAGPVELSVTAYVGEQVSGVHTRSVQVDDAPTVTSDDFVFPDRDGIVGQAGEFAFRPRTTDVVAYRYWFNHADEVRVPAAPDGTATMSWTPEQPDWYSLYVRSERADGSLSEVAQYQFSVIDNRPGVYSGDLVVWPRRDGVGVPVEFSFDTAMPDVTGFVYRFNDEAEQTVPAEFGSARISWTPSRSGEQQVTVRSRFSSGELSPPREWPFSVWSGPVIDSPQYGPGGTGGRVDQPATFTFRPGLPNVQRYTYRFEQGVEQTVEAAADGTATVTYTPGSPGYQTLEVTSHSADGTVSDLRTFAFIVDDNRVSVYGWYGPWHPQGGIGVPGHVSFHSQLFPNVVEYLYRVNDGPEQTIAASTEGTSTYLTITPDRNGENTLYVRQRTKDGQPSPITEYVFLVGTAPLVTSTEYPNNTWGGGAGTPGTFTFGGGTAGIVEFEYRIGGDEPRTVTAVDGSASMTWTPSEPGGYDLTVRGRRADGTWTDTTTYQVLVRY